MKLFESKRFIALLGVLAMAFSGCASDGSKPADQQIEAPQTTAPEPDKKLFSQALKAQNTGQTESAIKLWKSYLAKHPESFEGHNNLGLVYYNQDMLTQALQEFETAYRIEPGDKKIRQNLARALRFKATMLHDSREYFKTLEILARLEEIVEPEEKQAILFKQEQVEDQIYLQVIKANNSAAYQDFVNRFPDGFNAVRAREFLEEHPNRVSKSTTKRKSWISSGKATKNPSGDPGDLSTWASTEKLPDYSSASPTAMYTPPPKGASKKKAGDFFGVDDAAVEKVTEEEINATQKIDPVAAIPFDDFQKPERSMEVQLGTREPAEGKDNRRVAGESDTMDSEPDMVVAGLDTHPDLKPVAIVTPPAEMVTPASAETLAEENQMQSAGEEAETTATASAEETGEPATQEESTADAVQSENVQPEQTSPEPAQEMQAEQQASPEEKVMEAAGISSAAKSIPTESVESESERIERVVREEIARSESEQPEPAEEMQAASESEEPLEVATFDPEPDVQPEAAPAESAAIEETPSMSDSEEQQAISPETVSETVAALIPSPPSTEAMEPPSGSTIPKDSSNTVVVVQMRKGSTLNVRANPSRQGKILGYLENGDMMPFVSESGDWYQIEIEDGLSGWVSKNFTTTRDATFQASLDAQKDDMTSELSPLQPEQSTGDVMVIVTVSEDSTLNVRSIPSSSGAVVDMLFGGDRLPLVKEEGDWYQVQFEDETTGWISKKFSVIEGTTVKASLPAPVEQMTSPNTSPQPSDEMTTTMVVIKVPEESALNVRSIPSSEGEVVGSLKNGDMRPLLEERGDWYQIQLRDGGAGWVSRKFSGKLDLGSSFVQNP